MAEQDVDTTNFSDMALLGAAKTRAGGEGLKKSMELNKTPFDSFPIGDDIQPGVTSPENFQNKDEERRLG